MGLVKVYRGFGEGLLWVCFIVGLVKVYRRFGEDLIILGLETTDCEFSEDLIQRQLRQAKIR